VAHPLASRRLFLLAVAIIAAALADPIVESLANAGILGGHYTDNNHLSVIPAFVVGGIFALVTLALDSWNASRASNDWLVEVAKSFSKRSPVEDLPCVFVLQLLALFFMESAEQLAFGGKLLGGTAWLGGPIICSLIVHAVIGIGCLFALAGFMRGLLRSLASLVRAVVQFIWLGVARPACCFYFGQEATPLFRAQAAHVNQIGGRAPPLLHTPA